jgi:hypothetical protein
VLLELGVEGHHRLGRLGNVPVALVGHLKTRQEQGDFQGPGRAPALRLPDPVKELLGKLQVVQRLAAELPPVLKGLQFF